MQNKEINEDFNYGKDFFEVERIITRKYKGDKKYYLVKWVGHSLKDCSWEPASNLENIKSMVENFDNNYPNSIKKRLLKKYFRLIHGSKRNRYRNKNHLELKKNLQNKDDSNNNNLIIRIHNSINFNKEEKEKEKEEKYKRIEVLIKRSDNKDDEEYKQETLDKINDEKKYEDKIVNKGDINLFKIENKPTNDNDAPKLIRPIIIW